METRLAKKPTLAETIKIRLEQDIFKGRFKPGDRLREDEISNAYSVSRTPVREAFKLLASTGLVEVQPRQGAVIRKLLPAELVEMFQVMAELEGMCARLASGRITPAQRRSLEDSHKECARLAKSGDHMGFYEANIDFHEIIYESSCNAFLRLEVQKLRRRLSPYRRQITFYPGRMHNSIPEHKEVLEAILNGDSERADKAMRGHVNVLGDSMVDYLAILTRDPKFSSSEKLVRRAKPSLLGRYRNGTSATK